MRERRGERGEVMRRKLRGLVGRRCWIEVEGQGKRWELVKKVSGRYVCLGAGKVVLIDSIVLVYEE